GRPAPSVGRPCSPRQIPGAERTMDYPPDGLGCGAGFGAGRFVGAAGFAPSGGAVGSGISCPPGRPGLGAACGRSPREDGVSVGVAGRGVLASGADFCSPEGVAGAAAGSCRSSVSACGRRGSCGASWTRRCSTLRSSQGSFALRYAWEWRQIEKELHLPLWSTQFVSVIMSLTHTTPLYISCQYTYCS